MYFFQCVSSNPERDLQFVGVVDHNRDDSAIKAEQDVIIIQRYDASTDSWVDEIVRHASWQAHKTARAKSLLNGHDYRIVSGYSGAVLETIRASEQPTR